MTTLKSNLLKKGKKGFTLTELAIVIAVIAILIAVLVPTFTSVITSAKETSALSNAKNAITEYTIEYQSTPDNGAVIVDGSDYYVIYDSTAEDTYTAVATSKYESAYSSNSSYVTIADATLLFTTEDGNVSIYGTDSSNTSITAEVKAAIEEKITSAIESYSNISTYVSNYTLYATDGYYWWSVTVTSSSGASTGIQVAKVALTTGETTYTATLEDVDTTAESWTEPTSTDYTIISLTSESKTVGYLYAKSTSESVAE